MGAPSRVYNNIRLWLQRRDFSDMILGHIIHMCTAIVENVLYNVFYNVLSLLSRNSPFEDDFTTRNICR